MNHIYHLYTQLSVEVVRIMFRSWTLYFFVMKPKPEYMAMQEAQPAVRPGNFLAVRQGWKMCNFFFKKNNQIDVIKKKHFLFN